MSLFPFRTLQPSATVAGINVLTTPMYRWHQKENMQFPQILSKPVLQRQITDIEQLAEHQIGKYRRYTQLQSGSLNGNLSEVRLDGVVIAREKLNVGFHIEAAPPKELVPIASLLSNTEGMRFCGSQFTANDLMQASGNEWQLFTKQNIDYVTSIMVRTELEHHTQCLTGETTQPDWFYSHARQVDAGALHQYQNWLVLTLQLLQQQPELLGYPAIRRQLSGHTFTMAVKLLLATRQQKAKIARRSRRLNGVRRVIDYLEQHAAYLPTMSELCKVASLSERSLEYGFREQFNLTPIRYLKQLRLNRARQALYMADPNHTKVVDIALNWGFVEFGRFAGEYKQLFNELPSHTLRRGD